VGVSELLKITWNEADVTCLEEFAQLVGGSNIRHFDQTVMAAAAAAAVVVVVLMIMTTTMMTHVGTNPVSRFKILRFVITHSFTFTISFASVTFHDTVATDELRMISLFTQPNIITVPLAISVIA
jgi:hypothetical protein